MITHHSVKFLMSVNWHRYFVLGHLRGSSIRRLGRAHAWMFNMKMMTQLPQAPILNSPLAAPWSFWLFLYKSVLDLLKIHKALITFIIDRKWQVLYDNKFSRTFLVFTPVSSLIFFQDPVLTNDLFPLSDVSLTWFSQHSFSM